MKTTGRSRLCSRRVNIRLGSRRSRTETASSGPLHTTIRLWSSRLRPTFNVYATSARDGACSRCKKSLRLFVPDSNAVLVDADTTSNCQRLDLPEGSEKG